MTTELSIIAPGATDLTTAELDALIAAELSADREAHAFEFTPTRIKMPSGAPPYRFSAGDEVTQEITGIIAVSQMARAYWPGKETLNLPPVCASPDSMTGWLADSIDEKQVSAAMTSAIIHPGLRSIDAERGPYHCQQCPLSAWGTGNGRGQACKSLRRLLILVEGWSLPAVLTLPPTSTKAFDEFASARSNKRQAYFSCRVRLTLEAKNNANMIKFAAIRIDKAGELDSAELATVLAVRSQYAELVRRMEITASEYNTEGLPPF